MVEVTLISTGDMYSNVGRFVSRKRANLEALAITKNEFIKGFVRNNMSELDAVINNADFNELINSDRNLSNKDIESINYILGEMGYKLLVSFVADDEENPDSVGEGLYEYNIIDKSFIQNDLPTSTKITKSTTESLGDTLIKIVEQSGLFNPDKFSGIRNPFTILLNNIKDQERTTGSIQGMTTARIYSMLSYMGIDVYVIVGMQ